MPRSCYFRLFQNFKKIVITPFLALPVDHKMIQIWYKMYEAWNSALLQISHLKVISVSSGFKDDLIEELLTAHKNVTHFSTTSLDRVWLEADHQCIVWCNQLVRYK